MPHGRRRPGRPLHLRDLLRRPLLARRDGHAGAADLAGLAAAFVVRYDDDEPGSPWSFVVHVDERGSEEQRQALAAILTGELGGEASSASRG